MANWRDVPVQRDASGNIVSNVITNNQDEPILLLGGDHPYAQWGGNGLAQLYRDSGVRPYLAINTHTTGRNNLDPGDTDMLTWAEVAALRNQGVEIVGHAARHIQDWQRINTGISIVYTGANGTATVAISATQITCTDSGANAFTLADFTLATLKTAIDAVTGWLVTLAPELTGDEPASALLQIAASSVKTTARKFAAGGALTIIYTGTTYRDVIVRVQSLALNIYADGARIANIVLSGGAKLSDTVTAVNAITGMVAKLSDNMKTENSAFESYVSGDELSASVLANTPGASCLGFPLVLEAGLAHWYMVERQLAACSETAAANGVTLTEFASSGGNWLPHTHSGHLSFNGFRGNGWDSADSSLASNLPKAVPTYLLHHTRPVCALTGSVYTSAARITAIWNALADSPGFTIDALMHGVTEDGSSSYAFTPATDDADQTETIWVPAVQALGAHIQSGAIRSLKPSEVRQAAAQATRPRNYIFNSRFRNSGETLTGQEASIETLMPGWHLLTPAASFSAFTAADGVVAYTMSTASEVNPLSQLLYLEPGKTYEIGVFSEILNYTTGNGVSMQLSPTKGRQRDGWAAQLTHWNRSRYSTSRQGLVSMRFTVPPAESFGKARIVSAAFGAGIDMSTNKNIRLNVFAAGAFDIDCSAGASNAASVQAHEAAAAINTAIRANSAYRAELHNIASAENAKVILEVPKRSPDGSFQMTVVAGSSASITATMFGNTDNMAFSRPWEFESLHTPLRLQLYSALASGTQVRLSNPFCAEFGVR